ncbi:MAG TPA: shikimate kinase [Vicinamibacterales bacterium]|jgi:shikimate kinase|nr:shikimate kinase [Vicinamibacterales bacterium]
MTADVLTPDKIYLVGFMAAGKTSVARALGARLGWRVEDLDELVEARERLPIADIFARYGEPYFRAVERDMLKLVLPLRHTVVATGGGTFADPENRAAINLDGISIWLDVPLAEILARLPADGRRPLARDLADLEQLYQLRRAAYQQAHLRVDASRAKTGEIVERILDRLKIT